MIAAVGGKYKWSKKAEHSLGLRPCFPLPQGTKFMALPELSLYFRGGAKIQLPLERTAANLVCGPTRSRLRISCARGATTIHSDVHTGKAATTELARVPSPFLFISSPFYFRPYSSPPSRGRLPAKSPIHRPNHSNP